MTTQTEHYCMVYCTCPDQSVAERIADTLVDKNLAACVNIIPHLKSVYRWKGVKESSQEALILIKTRLDCYANLEAAIRALHPYELPEVIAVPITRGLSAYLAWINENVTT